jgi:hypothetical protein
LTDGLDIWLYFLRHAEKIDPEALPRALDHPHIQRAMEELKVLTQTDIGRERYEARRKAQLDYNSDIKAARMEGKAEGETIGLTRGLAKGKIGEIHLCERLLQRTETPSEQ